MTVSLKHAFTSGVADSGDASLVQPSNWNAEHTLTAGADTLLGAVTAGSVTEITCTSAGRALLDDADAAAQRSTLAAAGTGVSNTFTGNQTINGNLGLGTSSLTGVNFRNSNQLTGGTSVSASRTDGTIQSDVTAHAIGSYVVIPTQATTFTLSALTAYYLSQGTVGAGSAITNQYGFRADGNFIGATNNYQFYAGNTSSVGTGNTAYGFYSAVNAATGGGTNWGIYAAGTASNYFGGTTLFGTAASQGNARVQSAGDSVTAPFLGYASSFAQREVLRFVNGNGEIGSLGMTGTSLNLSTGGSVRATVTSGGNVGVGKTPSYLFDVNGQSAASQFILSGSGTKYITADTSGSNIVIQTNGGANAFVISSGGVYNTAVGGTYKDVYIDNTGVVGYLSSIRASKIEIQDQSDVSWLYALNPVTFRYRKKNEDGSYSDEADGGIQYGLIAEDVEQVNPEICFHDEEEDGTSILRGVGYSKLITPMLKAIQDLNSKITNLQNEFEQYKANHP